MDLNAAVWLVLLCLVFAANAPYFSRRLLLVGPRREAKPAAWLMLELLLLALACLALGRGLESRLGQVQTQGWEFYVAALCLFITLGFPGFVWRYLHKGRQ